MFCIQSVYIGFVFKLTKKKLKYAERNTTHHSERNTSQPDERL